jgi:calpain
MRLEEWKSNFNKVYVCKIFPSTWTQFSVQGEWKGNTAGGSFPFLDETKKDEENKGENLAALLDTNDRWFNNPQFRLSVTKKTNVIISLMQEDFNISKRPIIPVNFLVVRVKSRRDRLWEVEKDDVVLEAARGGSSVEQRELTRSVWLSPIHDKKPVHYIIVPNTELEGKGKEEERNFFLRVFSSEHIDLVQLPNTIETQFNSKWSPQTAGGQLYIAGKFNQQWCKNP